MVAALFFGAGNAWSANAEIHDPHQCYKVASHWGLGFGGLGYAFQGNYNTKGCYYYKSGKYKGRAYWGKGAGSKIGAVSMTGQMRFNNCSSKSEYYRKWKAMFVYRGPRLHWVCK